MTLSLLLVSISNKNNNRFTPFYVVSYQNLIFFSVEKLPDFADETKEENDEEEKSNSDMEDAGEEPAGHDRQDSNLADECKSKPMTTDQEDEKPNDKTEDDGTEFDGLQVHSLKTIICIAYFFYKCKFN